jgi:hypothetical protein
MCATPGQVSPEEVHYLRIRLLVPEPLHQQGDGLGEDQCLALVATIGNVCSGFSSTFAIQTLICNFGMGFSSWKPGKHPIRAIEVRDMLCNPYPERLGEPPHDFIHPFPVDQREIVCVHNPPPMEELGGPAKKKKKTWFWRAAHKEQVARKQKK